jgi:Asp/Glu/hydantoin racemase
MRLLLLNANTTEAVTEKIAAEARRVALPGTEILPVTGRFGGRIVGTRAEIAIAEHAALVHPHRTPCASWFPVRSGRDASAHLRPQAER